MATNQFEAETLEAETLEAVEQVLRCKHCGEVMPAETASMNIGISHACGGRSTGHGSGPCIS